MELTQKQQETFWTRVRIDDACGCWTWLGTKDKDGYGVYGPKINKHAVRLRAHRVSYVIVFGAVTTGLCLDHLCRQRDCVNPWHLEPVTSRENTLRGNTFPARNILKSHCSMGHAYDARNTYTYVRGAGIKRQCRRCCIDRTLERRIRLAA